MANDPTDPEYSLIQVNKTLSEIIVSICNCGISPKPWPVCTIMATKMGLSRTGEVWGSHYAQ